MEKTEMMKRYEDETGKHSVILKFMAGGQALESKDFPKIGPYEYSTEYIAWLESKANISDEAIEAFQKIIRNQCDEISALKEKAEAYDRLMSGGKKTIQEVANFFGVPMEWTGREVMFRIGEYTLTKSMENFIENPDTNYVVRFEPEKEATDD